jgi:hypothetical protein
MLSCEKPSSCAHVERKMQRRHITTACQVCRDHKTKVGSRPSRSSSPTLLKFVQVRWNPTRVRELLAEREEVRLFSQG